MVMTPTVATGISLDQASITLTSAGQKATLTATVALSNATNKDVTWTSSNPAVATVSNMGVVTAVADGTAVITATTADGSNLSAQCNVTVNIDRVTITMATSTGTARTMIGYSSKFSLDFTNVSDVKAYIAIGFTDKKNVILARVNNVPANTGMVLKTDNASVKVNVPTTTSNVYYANLLQPAVADVTIQPTETIGGVGYTNLMVGTDSQTGELGFITFSTAVTRSNNSYLRVPTSFYQSAAASRQGLGMVFIDSESTDIQSLMHDGTISDGVCYDLQGRKVTPSKKGLYIRNGKKVYVK